MPDRIDVRDGRPYRVTVLPEAGPPASRSKTSRFHVKDLSEGQTPKKKRRRKSRARRGADPVLLEQRSERQMWLTAFAQRHGIGCFVCGDLASSRWAKSGFSRRRAWIICASCVEARQAEA